MRKLIAWLTTFVFALSSCTFHFEVMTPAPVQETLFPTHSISSPTVTISPTAVPLSPTPAPFVGPAFYDAFFTSDPERGSREAVFPAMTKQVFAVWSYQNMRAGLHIKREWYLSGQLWFTHEEDWNFAQYGEGGVVQNVSLYDFDAGLPAGVYQLRIYIDNVIQPIGGLVDGQPDTQITFEIQPVTQLPASTPPLAGNLGWGSIHGKITDAITGVPIAGATVTCEHHSYTSTATCSGTATTNAEGVYLFENVFFHDTDRVRLAIQAEGYQPEEISQTSFIQNDMEANISLVP